MKLLLLIIIGFFQTLYAEDLQILDGNSFEGSIKAKGIIGFISVKGTLSFINGNLNWIVGEEIDSAPYKITKKNGTFHFTSNVINNDGDVVNWSGHYDGNTVTHVEAVWIREKGDFIHDLLLPNKVTLLFSPN